MIGTVRELKTDLLIIGGGIAGLNAAMAAREEGAQVTIMDKGGIARSGCIGAGVDHFGAYLEEGEPWDTKEAWLGYVAKSGHGAADLKVVEAVFCNEIKATIERMARIGNRLDDPATGRFRRTRSFGQPGPYFINFEGRNFKPNLARAVRQMGCQVLEKTMGTRLFTKEGRATGGLGFNLRTGETYAVQAKAVLVSTGIATRLYENPNGNPFNTWQSPFNSGDGQAMAFRAGAHLTNMEYMYMTLIPKGFGAAGLNALMGMGGYLINSAGERFMFRYSPEGEKAPRGVLVQAVINELSEGRGPVYVDVRHLSSEEIKHLKATLSWDKATFTEYLEQKGLDISREPMEIMPSEAMGRGASDVVSSGVKIDEKCASTLPGLYAAGDGCDQMRALSGATTGGFAAGRQAARWAKNIRAWEPLNPEETRQEKERLLAPLKRRKGISYQEFEDVMRKVMGENVGLKRSEFSLRNALSKLKKLTPWEDELMAADFHERARMEESLNLLTIAGIMASAALFRKESRFGVCHQRIDYPGTDNDKWLGQVVVKRKGAGLDLSFRPLKY